MPQLFVIIIRYCPEDYSEFILQLLSHGSNSKARQLF